RSDAMLHYGPGARQMEPMSSRHSRFARLVLGAPVFAASIAVLVGSSPPLRADLEQAAAAPRASFPSADQIRSVRQYIRQTWSVLTRSARDLPRAAPDPKMPHAAGDAWPVYIATDEDRAAIVRMLQTTLTLDDLRQIDVRVLPSSADQVREHGLLYLPHPY